MVAEIVIERAEPGEVFTRRRVVDTILDLVGYTPNRDLANLTIVEPSVGVGAFLAGIVDRLVRSVSRRGRTALPALPPCEICVPGLGRRR